MLTPNRRLLICMVAVLGFAFAIMMRQHPKPAQTVSESSMDAMEALDGGTLLQVSERAQIASLEERVHDIELTSRSVGLLTLRPGPWKRGWTATFYTGQAGINGSGTGITKSGNPLAPDWTIAADPNVLPLGTIIEIEYANGRVSDPLQVTDTGGAIRGQRLDVYVPNEHEDIQLGRQRVKIRILRMG